MASDDRPYGGTQLPKCFTALSLEDMAHKLDCLGALDKEEHGGSEGRERKAIFEAASKLLRRIAEGDGCDLLAWRGTRDPEVYRHHEWAK